MDLRAISCPNGTVYKIKSGDTFFKLAQQFNVSVDAIIAANPGVNPNNLQIGQEICIPVKPSPGPCPGGTLYTIVAGDTFFTIAIRFNVSVDALVAANPGVNPDKLQIGQQICIPGKPAPNPCPGGTPYTVVAGDTFFTIARRFNVSVDALVAANPGVNPDKLQIGQQICIPGKPAPGPCPGGTLYTIKAGDTFYTIAGRFNVSVDALIAANPGVDPNNLQIGQKICIPGTPAPACPGGTMHTIVAGDTLYKLAIQYNTSVNAIIAANPGIDPNKLQIGQMICIPGKPAPVPCPGGSMYTIVAGDTVYKLAIRFNTSVKAILDANPGLDPNRLQIGQMICIPGKPAPGPCPGETYTIRQGDTLYIIAQRLGIRLDDLLKANPGIDPNRLSVGQVICLPVKPSGPCPGGTIYVVKSGDTLQAIAKRFNVSVQQIMMANPEIKDPNVIYIGQSICIPGSARSEEGSAENFNCPFAPYFMDMFYNR